MTFLVRHRLDLVILTAAAAIQWAFRQWFLRSRPSPLLRQGSGWVVLAVWCWLAAAVVLEIHRIAVHFPPVFVGWFRGGALLYSVLSLATFPAVFLASRIRRPAAGAHPGRRYFLETARAALIAAPVATVGYGVFVQRSRFRLREVDLPCAGLPPDLNGLRLVQLSDIHLSPFLSVKELEYNVDMANETRAHVALVTGDLISGYGDPLDACLDRLSRLRADAGILGCLGNHEKYAEVEDYTALEGARRGIRFLRRQSAPLRFGGAALRFTGVDYEKMGGPYLGGMERFVDPAAYNILLSHNPDVFPTASRKGFRVTLSGHTHGGQVNFEILEQSVNVVRFFTPYVYGLYRRGPSAIYVTRGIGTVGVPARIGAPPEVALLRLCAI